MRLIGLVVACLLTLALAACSDDDDNTGPEGEARVRVVHASPDAPDVDVLVEFLEGRTPGWEFYGTIPDELSAILGGRKIDMFTPADTDARLNDLRKD